jgi:hypothetical protein
VQDNYQISSSEVCREGVLSPDNALSSFPSRHEGNPQELVGYGKYSGSSLTASSDQKLHDQATIVNNSWANTDQHCHKVSLSGSQDAARKPIGSVKARYQSIHDVITPVKRQSSHGKLTIRSILRFKPQNSQLRCEGTPHAISTKKATKIYHDHISHFKMLREVRKKLPILSKDPHSRTLDAPSTPMLSTSIATASMLSAPINKANSRLGIGSWTLDGNFSNPKSFFAACLDVLPSLFNDEVQNTFTQYGSKSNGTNSEKSGRRASKDARRAGQNERPEKRKRFFEGGGNREKANDENDENDDGDDSTQRTPNKSSPEYTKRGLLACPFYKNDPEYFTADLFHDGKYFLCASRGFPDIARLK